MILVGAQENIEVSADRRELRGPRDSRHHLDSRLGVEQADQDLPHQAAMILHDDPYSAAHNAQAPSFPRTREVTS